MSFTGYKMIRCNGDVELNAAVAAAIADGMQPYGDPMYDRPSGFFAQAMVTGTPSGGGGNLPAGDVAVADGDVLTVRHNQGSDAHNGTVVVFDGAISQVTLPDSTALVDNGTTLTIQDANGNQATCGVVVTGGFIAAEVDVNSNSAIINDQYEVNGATVTGTYSGPSTGAVIFTVVDGVITAIDLS